MRRPVCPSDEFVSTLNQSQLCLSIIEQRRESQRENYFSGKTVLQRSRPYDKLCWQIQRIAPYLDITITRF